MPSESILYRGLTACHAPVCCIIYKAHSTNMGINIFIILLYVYEHEHFL